MRELTITIQLDAATTDEVAATLRQLADDMAVFDLDFITQVGHITVLTPGGAVAGRAEVTDLP